MGPLRNLGGYFQVDAYSKKEVSTGKAPMYYSSAASKLIEACQARLGQRLRERSLDLAISQGRTTVSDEDVVSAFRLYGEAILSESLNGE